MNENFNENLIISLKSKIFENEQKNSKFRKN